MRLINNITRLIKPLWNQRACLLSFALFVMITTACAPTLRESLNPRTLQAPISKQSRVHVDVKASEIRWEEPISINFEPKKLRRNLAFAIQDVLNGPIRKAERLSDSKPTRFLLEVHSLNHSYKRFLFPCLIYFAFLGCPVDTIRAEISLTLDYQGEFFRASTSGEATFNHFQYGLSAHPPEVRAVGVAMSEALKMIMRSVKAPVDSRRGEGR